MAIVIVDKMARLVVNNVVVIIKHAKTYHNLKFKIKKK